MTVSQLLNEYFAKEAGLEDWQLGLGHAFEINPEVPDSFRLELAHALLARAAVPGCAAEVDAADQAHDRRRLPRLPARRLLQPGRRDDRAGHPAGRDDDRGRRHAVPVRPRPGAAERALRAGRRRQAARGLPSRARRLHRPSRQPGAGRGGRAAGADHGRARRHRAAVGDRRRDVRADEAAGRRGQGATTASWSTRRATSTRPPTSSSPQLSDSRGPGKARDSDKSAARRGRAR